MRFAFTDDHIAICAATRDLLRQRCGPAQVRAAWEAAPGALDRSVWSSLVDMGVMDVLVPEPSGGLGMDYVALVGIVEEAGRVAMPHPIVETAAVAAPLLPDGPGDSMIGASWRWGPVACGSDVEQVVLVDEHEVRLHERAGLELEPVDTVDRGRRLAKIVAARGDGVLLTDDGPEVSAAFDRAALGVAAQLVGVADMMLALTVDHVTERTQFGVPVGSFQAVKHHLADALMEVSFARPVVHQAAYAVAHAQPDASREVSKAKVLAAEAAGLVGRRALQCHGAVGYTVEHDLHLYLKRSWALTRSWGNVDWHTERVAAALAL